MKLGRFSFRSWKAKSSRNRRDTGKGGTSISIWMLQSRLILKINVYGAIMWLKVAYKYAQKQKQNFKNVIDEFIVKPRLIFFQGYVVPSF